MKGLTGGGGMALGWERRRGREKSKVRQGAVKTERGGAKGCRLERAAVTRGLLFGRLARGRRMSSLGHGSTVYGGVSAGGRRRCGIWIGRAVF